MTKPQKPASKKALAEAIYHIDPFEVAQEAKAIALVATLFRKSSAPEFMLECLLEDLQSVASQKRGKPWLDLSHFLENVDDMLKEMNSPAEPTPHDRR